MNYTQQEQGLIVHPSDSLPTNPGHPYFEMRDVDSVGAQIRQQLTNFHATIASHIAVEMRSLHDRIGAIEGKLDELMTNDSRTLQMRLSDIENKLSEITYSQPPKNSTGSVGNGPASSGIINDGGIVTSGSDSNLLIGIPQTPASQTRLGVNVSRLNQTPTPLTPSTTGTNSSEQSPASLAQSGMMMPIVAHSGRESLVSQLPSEESAKVKVLLRQFAGKAMTYIEQNAPAYVNVNNHVGAITTMKRFDIYDSAIWDQFVETNFPHISKPDLKDELVKIVSVKVKNTKARYKKRASNSQHSQLNQQLQLTDPMSESEASPSPKRLCSTPTGLNDNELLVQQPVQIPQSHIHTLQQTSNQQRTPGLSTQLHTHQQLQRQTIQQFQLQQHQLRQQQMQQLQHQLPHVNGDGADQTLSNLGIHQHSHAQESGLNDGTFLLPV
ncbi:hypothetical protein K493DRAFT_15674 [Basidiobolus meristosporus CBS 931.73]|uniref:Uncharacterized protein n=1 Tax=Basidiobolus meristosporus CBS 931.73 TaxID=1314790 RepID=A0A1Y1YGW4_9FUNG|nr:hypothetical protein K493DRAFT_15674 [Basidiobolus meristosporus CBS 931.73]|eukprot:ORX97219.1 hypothetical protein K493DRAFT_15674 [Basidiobolus meristosporus CBS 931.73]